MININLIVVGNLKENFWKEAEGEYLKRLSKFCKLNIIELKEQNKFANAMRTLQEEGREILSKLSGKPFLLDVHGREISSEEFSQLIEKESQTESTLTFIIGGSYGVAEEVKSKIKNKLSFGRITYPHNLARIVLLEQLYRAFMISNGREYHK